MLAPVSVIIPCYRCAGTIGRAMGSVMAQSALPAEVWLVDDASDDDGCTLAALDELQRLYSDRTTVGLIPLAANGGPSAARNAGWEASTQPYLAFLDADDAWHPRKIEVQYSWMRARPGVVLTGHPYILTKPDSFLPGQPDDRHTLPADWRALPVNPCRLLLSNRFSTPCVMLRRDLPHRFEPAKKHCEDYLLWLQLVLEGYPAWSLELPLAYIFKAPFGERGLSAELWKMEKGEVDAYWRLYRQGAIGPAAFCGLSLYSFFKFLRRGVIKFLET